MRLEVCGIGIPCPERLGKKVKMMGKILPLAPIESEECGGWLGSLGARPCSALTRPGAAWP